MDDKPFSTETLAERWDCSTQHIRDLVNSGDLPAIRIGRLIRIPARIVEEYETCSTVSLDTEENGQSGSPTAAGYQPASLQPQKIVMLPNKRHVKL